MLKVLGLMLLSALCGLVGSIYFYAFMVQAKEIILQKDGSLGTNGALSRAGCQHSRH